MISNLLILNYSNMSNSDKYYFIKTIKFKNPNSFAHTIIKVRLNKNKDKNSKNIK